MNSLITMIFTYCAIAFYVCTFVIRIIIEHRNIKSAAAWITWGIAGTCNLAVVMNNWVINGYVPLVSMYQVLTFLALFFLPIYLYINWIHKSGWMAKYFVLLSAVCLTGAAFMNGGDIWHFPPALQSVWFVPHVFAYMVGYILCTVSFVLVVIKIGRKIPLFKRFTFVNIEEYDCGIYRLICTAFPFMTAGMLLGAIWADSVWGSFWMWDIKETWALVTWIFYLTYLHFARMMPQKKGIQTVLVILGFIGILVTMFGLNVITGNSSGASPHVYSA